MAAITTADATTPRSQYLASITRPTSLSADDADCAVCAETMQVKDDSTSNRACYVHGKTHILCASCLERHTLEKATCPFCRAPLFSRPEDDEPGQDDTIPAPLPAEPNGDNSLLTSVLGPLREQYVAAAASGNPATMVHATRQVLAPLRQRLQLWQAGSFPTDVPYQVLTRIGMDGDFLGPEEERPIRAASLVPGVFDSWYFELGQVPEGYYDVVHHPVGTALLLETVRALRGWEGDVSTPAKLRRALDTRLKSFERGLDVPNELEVEGALRGYREWLLDMVQGEFVMEEEMPGRLQGVLQAFDE